MTTLAEYATTELEKSGEDPPVAHTVLAVVAVLERHGGRPGVVGRIVDLVQRVVARQPLSPLTRHPWEWLDMQPVVGEPLWQSARDPRAFSTDGGATYTYEDDPVQVRHTSVVPSGWVHALCVRHYMSFKEAVAAVEAYFAGEQMTVEDVSILDTAGSEASRREYLLRRWPGPASLVAAMLYEPPEGLERMTPAAA